MNWAETMKGNATVASLATVDDDERVFHRTPAASWEPLDVWLTRIKEPRDSAASSAPAGTTNGRVDRRD